MSTICHIPISLVGEQDFDINGYMAGRGFTVVQRARNDVTWDITLAEDLTAGQQTATAVDLDRVLQEITWEVIP